MTRLTVREWAAHIGVSKQAAYAAIKRCSIPVGPDGRVDAKEATLLYRSRTRARAAWRAPQPAAASREAQAPADADDNDLVDLARDIVDIMLDAERPHLLAEGAPHLWSVLFLLNAEQFQRVPLPERVKAALRAYAEPERAHDPAA